jgi:hypothetical protein
VISSFQPQALHTFLVSPTQTTWTTRLSLLELIPITISGEGYEFWSYRENHGFIHYSLYSFRQAYWKSKYCELNGSKRKIKLSLLLTI